MGNDFNLKTQNLITLFLRGVSLFSGQIHPNVYFTFNRICKFAGTNNFLQIRDAYFDLSFDAKEYQ
jgi:hypothetical protein